MIKVSPSGKRIVVQEDTSIRTEPHGMSDRQSYRFEPNPRGRTWTTRRTRQGWTWMANGTPITVGHRSTYHDYSF